jgi:hypothetical protein
VKISSEQVLAALKSVRHKACWHVSVGGCTLPTFSLAIGGKNKRDRALRNPAQPVAFRKYEPEISFFVWCAWRLECGDLVVASDDGDADEITRSLKRIVGKSVAKIEVTPPAWDLVMSFDKGLRLVVFCNHAGKKPSFSGNWQAKVQHTRIIAGPGIKLEVARLGTVSRVT